MFNNLQRKTDLGTGGIFLGKCLAAFCLLIFNNEKESSINKWIKGEMGIFAAYMSWSTNHSHIESYRASSLFFPEAEILWPQRYKTEIKPGEVKALVRIREIFRTLSMWVLLYIFSEPLARRISLLPSIHIQVIQGWWSGMGFSRLSSSATAFGNSSPSYLLERAEQGQC